jgi:hypothetical protein
MRNPPFRHEGRYKNKRYKLTNMIPVKGPRKTAYPEMAEMKELAV